MLGSSPGAHSRAHRGCDLPLGPVTYRSRRPGGAGGLNLLANPGRWTRAAGASRMAAPAGRRPGPRPRFAHLAREDRTMRLIPDVRWLWRLGLALVALSTAVGAQEEKKEPPKEEVKTP